MCWKSAFSARLSPTSNICTCLHIIRDPLYFGLAPSVYTVLSIPLGISNMMVTVKWHKISICNFQTTRTYTRLPLFADGNIPYNVFTHHLLYRSLLHHLHHTPDFRVFGGIQKWMLRTGILQAHRNLTQLSFQLPCACEVVIKLFGPFQCICEQDWRIGSRKSVHVTQIV